MLTRYFTVIGILLLLALMVRVLLNRQQKRALHQLFVLFSKLLLLTGTLITLLTLLLKD
ncbi:hypothetical protein MIS45_01960 [Wielerella bovis]|uniref:protein MIGRI n=1 Tax=Wielerella bovis TaxID=2917790 RepID=UPI0020189E8F|nr:hypothetical protein [Wielerella bovis]ULJ69645.1 hypothetical protein MIS45_01960 [Wielerella bovis]